MQLHHQNKLKISEDPLEIIVKVIRFFATFICTYLLDYQFFHFQHHSAFKKQSPYLLRL